MRLVPELGAVKCCLNSRSVKVLLDQEMYNKKGENQPDSFVPFTSVVSQVSTPGTSSALAAVLLSNP